MKRLSPCFFGHVVVALTASLAVAASSGCSRSMLAAIFVEHDKAEEVDMLRLVESPAGHISGSLVVSSLNSDGSRKKDAIYDVSGTLTGPNVSLQVNSGVATLAQLFGTPTNLVGTLSGGTLTLSVGNNTLRLREMSQREYAATLAKLDTVGKHIAMLEEAQKAVQEVTSNGQQLNTDMRGYIRWGQERIDHTPVLRQWYAQRISQYTKCLQTIRPLAAAGTPAWRWQDCAISIENDKYGRDQMVESVRNLQSQNQQSVDRLNARISAAQDQFPKAVDALNSACSYAKDVGACAENVRKLNSLLPNGFLDKKLIADFKDIILRVNAAIISDEHTSDDGENRLSSLAQDADRVYRSAR
jgi:hypothetical protein